ncbi:DUF4209 domain-containing protein [Arthrobacter sp. zg-Y750]|uniref:DUF4209 domain-containing protein n=1 Tax=Arthrobacter sp. zg-Y750 TaxID=2894189 RepID=UPI001E49439D|nr:DUF4209 domain-containing protein [Arthrobacter sp. zg-Y750]MCC9177672.1 DUF4209 domain-containing protein [Arthrobacter sp. zg-Y750]
MSDKEREETLALNAEAFDWSALDDALIDCATADYYEMHKALRSTDVDEDMAEHDKRIFHLLSEICFLHFAAASRNMPYTPAIQLGDRRSFSLDDLTPQSLAFLVSAAPRIVRPDLRGRVWDILWLKRRDLGIRTALAAIEAYSAVNLPASQTVRSHSIVDCWDRALSLARTIRGAGVAVIEPLEAKISDALSQALIDFNTIARELSLLSIRYGLDADKREDRSQAFRAMANKLRDESGHFAERVFLQAASDWEAANGRSGDYWNIVQALALSHELEATQEEESAEPSYIRIATMLEQAIQQYRRIPRQFRAEGFETSLAELRQRHAAAGARAVEEMSLIESDPIDLSELAEEAKSRVSGKPVLDALYGLISLFPIPTREELLSAEREQAAEGSLSSIFPKSILHEDGRVIARVPAADSTNDEEVILVRAIENYSRRIEIVVRGAIIPGLEAFNQEHCIRERELLPLVAESAAVPPGREAFFTKGLAAGFDWDFMSSSHLLVPQLEAFLRYHIRGRGGDTTVLNLEGIHTEASLGTLLEMEQTADILGPNMTFLFDAFLVNPHGPNFRNVQAHGLIGETGAGGVHSVFAWWLCLYLVILPFWASGKSGVKGNQKAD